MITAVISKKGGVGKTTTSVNLSAALARAGYRVLVVDLDPNAGASLSLGVAKQELGPGSADILLRGTAAETTVRNTGVEELFVIPASIDLRSAEVELDRRSRKETVLQQALAPIGRYFDFIFCDCPSSVGLLTRNAIVASQCCLLPALPHFLAVEGLEQLIETVDRLGFKHGNGSRFLGIVLTMVDYRAKTTRVMVKDLRQRFQDQVFLVEIRTNISLAEAPAFGQTVYEYKPYATGAKAYRLLAEEFASYAQPHLLEPLSTAG